MESTTEGSSSPERANEIWQQIPERVSGDKNPRAENGTGFLLMEQGQRFSENISITHLFEILQVSGANRLVCEKE